MSTTTESTATTSQSPTVEEKMLFLKGLNRATSAACQYLKDDLKDDRERLAKRRAELSDRYRETTNAANEYAKLMELGIVTQLPYYANLIHGERLSFESVDEVKKIARAFGPIVFDTYDGKPSYDLVNTTNAPAEGEPEMVWVNGKIPGFECITVRWKAELPADAPCKPVSNSSNYVYRSLVCERQ